ncbi:winged helix-turn-helix domain-containing protein [Salinispora arenicola]|uniref:winged helix-turn-helix domain-containing protein n=1 Tax=Salinispora arenicola TaxID=168697 RepID=UPI0012F8F6CD|nr:winged helix-turn-helix domain-containing protein [Salinispora arenicola]
MLTAGTSPGQLQLLFDALPPTARDAGIIAGRRSTTAQHRRIVDDAHGPRLAGQRQALSPSTTALLTADAAAGDASALLWRVMLRAALARWRLADITLLVDDPAMTGLEHARSTRAGGHRQPRSRAERDIVLHRQWRRAVEHAAGLPHLTRGPEDPRTATVTATVHAIETAAQAVPWRWATPGGPADRAALKALCVLALACCSLEVALDCRRWSRLTGHGKSTMATAATRLSRSTTIDGPAWISLITPAEGTKAAVWRLLRVEENLIPDPAVDTTRTQGRKPAPRGCDYTPQPSSEQPLRPQLRTQLEGELACIAHDVWAPRGGLGHHTQRTYAQLLERPRTVEELVIYTGYTTPTVRRHLAVLQHHRLAVRARGNRWRPGPAQLDRLAAKLGVSGIGRTRARRYLVDREVHAWWRDEQSWRQARGKRRERALPPARRQDNTQTVIPIVTGPRLTYGRFPVRAGGRADYTRAYAIVGQHCGLADLGTAS